MFRQKIIVLVIFALMCGTASVSAAHIITLDPQSVSVSAGSNSTVTIRVDELPQGLAGYQLRVTLADPGIAEIVGVSYPAWVKLSNSTAVPSDSVLMSGVDIDRQVEPGAKDVVLGTFTVRGDSSGSTGFVLSDLRVDADGGAVITLVPSPGTVIQPPTTIVSSTTAAPLATQGATGGSTGGGTSVGGSSSSDSSVSGQSTPVNTTTVTNATPEKTSVAGETTPVKVTTTAASVQITSFSQPVTVTTKAGIPFLGAGFISLIAIGIAMRVFSSRKMI